MIALGMARLDRVAPRNEIQAQLVVDVEHGACEAGVDEQEPDRALAGVNLRAGVENVGQRAE
jgi:hypothetical protein